MSASILAPKLLNAFIEEVYRHTGITMDESKKTMLTGRLRRRTHALELPSFEEYLRFLRENPDEIERFIDAVTTNKTSMFRTRSVWAYLAETWLPEHLAAGNRSVAAWSAASSSGQEAASLAITLAKAAETQRFTWRVTASDISDAMVQTARQQTFEAARIRRDAAAAPGLDPSGYFGPPDDKGCRQLNQDLRRNMTFMQHNLFDRAPVRRIDLLFVRNVIIYFSPEDKRRVLERALETMRPGGLLVIGESESLVGTHDDLELVSHCIYRRVGR